MKKLSALLALKNALSRQALSVEQYELVRRQVDDLKLNEQRESKERSQAATPIPPSVHHFPQGYIGTPPPFSSAALPVGGQRPVSGGPVMSDLAALLRKATGGTNPSIALPMTSTGSKISLQNTQTNVSSLLANLTKQGVLGQQQQPQDTTSAQAKGISASTTKSLQDLLALATGSTVAMKGDGLQLNSASLKM